MKRLFTSESVTEGCYDIGKMALKCQQNAETYDVNKVITKELLKKLNLV